MLQVVAYILCIIALFAFAVFLDWLHSKRPEWFGSKKPGPRDRQDRGEPASAPPAPDSASMEDRSASERRSAESIQSDNQKKDRFTEPAGTCADPVEPSTCPDTEESSAPEHLKPCDRCGTWRREAVGVLEELAGDAQGILFRCPQCGRFHYYNMIAFGGGRFTEVEAEWVERVFPNLGAK